MNKGLYLAGSGRSGKDEAGQILKDEFGLDFQSSSYFMASRVVYPALKDQYASLEDCFAGRHEPGMRKVWFDLITEYNTPDPTRLSRAIFAEYPVYVGIRNEDELLAMKRLPDWDILTMWIDASERVPPEPPDSMTLTIDMADLVIENNRSIQEFHAKVRKFGRLYAEAVV